MRKTLNRILLGWLLIVILVALFGKVGLAASGGRAAAEFLQIGVGAEAAGMGCAYTTVSSGASSCYWNPAGLANLDVGEISLSHISWLQDIKLEHGAAAFPLNDRYTLGASITYLNYGKIEGYDAFGSNTGEISSYDLMAGVSLGARIDDRFSAGLTAKIITEKLADVNATTFAADFGGKAQVDRFSFAFMVANLGPGLKFENTSETLPTSVRVASSFTPANQTFRASLEFEKQFQGESIIRQGVEVNFNQQYFLRGGYSFHPDRDFQSGGSNLSFGAGVRFSRAGIDYAYTPKDSFTSDDLHRFTLTVSLGQ